MFPPISRNLAFAFAISLTPSLGLAQDVLGTMTATMEGTERTWFLTAQDGQSQSYGMTIAVANMQSFTLWGQAAQDSVADIKGSLLLGFDVMKVGGNTIPLNVRLSYFSEGHASGWLTDEDGQAVVNLSALEDVDGGVHLEGDFSTTVYFSDNLIAGFIDPSKSMPIEGHFSATIPETLMVSN